MMMRGVLVITIVMLLVVGSITWVVIGDAINTAKQAHIEYCERAEAASLKWRDVDSEWTKLILLPGCGDVGLVPPDWEDKQ